MASKHAGKFIPAVIILTALILSSGVGRVFHSGTSSLGDNDGISNPGISVTVEATTISPVIFWVSDPVKPGEVVMAAGSNFGDSPQVELSWLKDKKPGQPAEVSLTIQKSEILKPLQVTDGSVKFLIPKDWDQGIYSFHISADGRKSAQQFINAPDPWWQQGDWGKEASPGGWLRVFGKCLSINGKATVALKSEKQTLILPPARQEQWSIDLALPREMTEGEYETWVHNGYGGQAGWKRVGTVIVKTHPPLWKADVFDIRDYGATGNDEYDDGTAIQLALNAASFNGGGIVHIPRGRFQVDTTLLVPSRVLLRGEGTDLSQLYWRDRVKPLEALIRGTHSFGVEDLTIIAVNHLAGIMSDTNTLQGKGNIFLRRLHIRLNRFEQLRQDEDVRLNPLGFTDRNGGAIAIDGENVQITDCEIFSSHAPFRLNMIYGLFSNNRCFQGGTSHFFSGKQVIFENNIVEGSHFARGGGDYVRQNLYLSRNRIGNMARGDAEIFTTDAHGRHDVKFVSIAGTTAALDQDVEWENLTKPSWTGNETRELALFITKGKGVGQYRHIKSWNGREVEFDRPWEVLPDEGSEIMLGPYYMHNLLINNEFHDGVVVQSWCLGMDWIIAGNKITRGGGIHNVGIGVSWYHQYLGNEILVGSGTRSPLGDWPTRDSHLAVFGNGSRYTVFRSNILHNNARIGTTGNRWSSSAGETNEVVIDHNIIRNADMGIDVTGQNNGVLIWRNQFENIKNPLVGLSDAVFMHPAERLLNLLSAEDVIPAELHNAPSWQAAWKRLESLQANDPASTSTLDEVRDCQTDLLKAAANELSGDQPLALIQALTGLTISEVSSDALKSILADGTGGTAKMNLTAFLPEWSVPLNLSPDLLPLPGWQITPPAQAKINPGNSISFQETLSIPSGVWGKPSIPLVCKISGNDWQLKGTAKLQLAVSGTPPTELINQWMVIGPFDSEGEGKDPIYNPLQKLDITAEYTGVRGMVRWQPVNAGRISFTRLYGPVENGIAYAVAVLRVSRSSKVAITNLTYSAVTFLNGERMGVANHRWGNHKYSRTLPAGDHILLCQVPQTINRRTGESDDWNLQVRVEIDPQTTPGDVQVLPADKFREIPGLGR